ncbi:type I-D CRISPR-associated protein Cas10d/Csc3 [Bacillus aquiflavi]|uniref:type I-D CRISPR-associated protein Cas10d/Csc3 n=1 Tax=Bacillus aquiflavi TaxID=2672567 RepID=UPI001CA94627|nr:type I-D CRISPR-associated protein Cas10d/Csc3 [Bacillus aquiflavi]UAC48351.1 type I-D CRISPR-associated protein Cas10d/Csc3 [Bacillus aquiflavi]
MNDKFSFLNQLLFQFRHSELSERVAKEHDYPEAKSHLVDQLMREHIESGIFALKSFISFLDISQVPVEQDHIEYACLAYVLHDIHKVEESKGGSVYAQSLDEFDHWREQLQQKKLKIPSAFLRLAGVSRFSGKYGDFSVLPPGIDWNYIRSLVKMMDRAASIISIREFLEGKGLSSLRQSLMELFPPSLQRKLCLEYHYIEETRGLLTNRLHQTVTQLMKESGYYPWLFFSDGTLYIKINQEAEKTIPNKELWINELVSVFYKELAEQQNINEEVLLDRSTLQLQTYGYLILSSTDRLLKTLNKLFVKPSNSVKKFPEDKFSLSQLKKYNCQTVDELFKKMLGEIPELTSDFREKWFYHARLFKVLLNVIRQLDDKNHKEAYFILADALNCQAANDIYSNIQNISISRRFDDTIWLSYYYLISVKVNDRSARELPLFDLYEFTIIRLKDRLAQLISREKVNSFVEEKLKISDDLKKYINEQLVFSSDKQRSFALLNKKELLKKRTGSQKRICNICNRDIIPKAEPKAKAAIIDDDIQVFSNRLLPKIKNVSALHWCPVCQLEFILRKVFAFEQPGERSYSKRLYLYVFPTYQLTSDRFLELEENIRHDHCYINVRSLGKDQETWQSVFLQPSWDDETVREYLLDHFNDRERLLNEQLEENGRLYSTGDLVKMSELSNYIMVTYDCYSSSELRTKEEVWMKAATLACSLNVLYGFRIYVTARPFFTMSNIDELVYAVHLDSPPLKVQQQFHTKPSALGEGIPVKYIRDAVQTIASLWEMNQHLHPTVRGKFMTDKDISSLLRLVQIHPLPGAHVVKRALSERHKIPELLRKAVIWWSNEKGEKKWMNLAQAIAEASFKLYIPNSKSDGRAHRYENLFRTVIKSIKNGAEFDEICGTVIKRLERLKKDQKQGRIMKFSNEDVKKLVEAIYIDFYQKECKGNLFKLNQRVNQLADGIYFVMHELVQNYWKNKQNEECVMNENK